MHGQNHFKFIRADVGCDMNYTVINLL